MKVWTPTEFDPSFFFGVGLEKGENSVGFSPFSLMVSGLFDNCGYIIL
jgi:hypothetical protein